MPTFWGAIEEIAMGLITLGGAVGLGLLRFRYGVVIYQAHTSKPAPDWSLLAGMLFTSIVGLLFVGHGVYGVLAIRRRNGS